VGDARASGAEAGDGTAQEQGQRNAGCDSVCFAHGMPLGRVAQGVSPEVFGSQPVQGVGQNRIFQTGPTNIGTAFSAISSVSFGFDIKGRKKRATKWDGPGRSKAAK
jgi:hypothetical protein